MSLFLKIWIPDHSGNFEKNEKQKSFEYLAVIQTTRLMTKFSVSTGGSRVKVTDIESYSKRPLM